MSNSKAPSGMSKVNACNRNPRKRRLIITLFRAQLYTHKKKSINTSTKPFTYRISLYFACHTSNTLIRKYTDEQIYYLAGIWNTNFIVVIILSTHNKVCAYRDVSLHLTHHTLINCFHFAIMCRR